MVKEVDKPRIEPYQYPAGGWGALKSVTVQLMQEGVSAKTARSLLLANQPKGFDCPGCAWPDRNPTASFEFCENGAKAIASEATGKRATPEVIGSRTVSEWATASDQSLEGLGRLTEPMRYDASSDRYERVTWDAAFAQVAESLNALPSPNEALFYTSGRTSNEAAFLYQLFVREFGTNNFPDCSNMCHEPSGVALKGSIGVGKGTVSLADFELADVILIFGQNPGTNHPRMMGELRAARKRGAKILSFNPLRERALERFTHPQDPLEMLTGDATEISSIYFRPTIGGDLAVATGICKALMDMDAKAEGVGTVLDHAFIAEHCDGFDDLSKSLNRQEWETIEQTSGLMRKEIELAASVIAESERVILCWGMGITQHQHAVATIEMMTNFTLLLGQIGKPGAGICPVRGHSNVQGDRTMGIDEKPTTAFLDRLSSVFKFEPPREPGLNTVESIAAMRDGKAKVFFAMGGNFAAATPDSAATHAALKQCELTVHVATKFNRSHVVHGKQALLLPCLGRTEIDQQASGPQHVTVEDSMSMVHLSGGINTPASPHLLSEPMIVARLAQAVLQRSQTRWAWLVEDYSRIRDRIADVFDDFANFNERVSVPGGFRLHNAAAHRVWRTASGKAHLRAHDVDQSTHIRRAAEATSERVFTLTTVRAHDQYNTTVYGLNDRYRGVYGQRRVVFASELDLTALGLTVGSTVDLISIHVNSGGQVEERIAHGFTLVPYDIPSGCLAGYYPETNALVPLDSIAERAGTPSSKSIPVVLRPNKRND